MNLTLLPIRPWHVILVALLLAPLAAHAVTLAESVDAAIARAPQAAPLAAERLTQEARRDAASRLFPGAPYAQADVQTDRVTGGRGFITLGAELGTPLWLPGEGRATGRQAGAGIAAVDARMGELRLTIAGLVREAVGLVEEAAFAIPPQERRNASARQLAGLTEQRTARGESPQADALLARSEALLAEAALREQQALMAQAMARFTGLTGLPTSPGLGNDRAPPTAPMPDHPALLAARRNVEAAQAALVLTRHTLRESPVIGLQTRQEQQTAREGYDSRIGVVFRLPFATDGRNLPRIAAAQAEVTRAEAALALLARELDIEIRQGRLALASAAEQRRLADAAFRALDERRGQIERAYAAGEIPLVELVRARVGAFEADAFRARARASQNRARSRLNQALGAMP